jgi:hypothetical protein
LSLYGQCNLPWDNPAAPEVEVGRLWVLN